MQCDHINDLQGIFTMAHIHHRWYIFTMPAPAATTPITPLTWKIPLLLRPQILDIGHNTHGVHAEFERFQKLNFWSLHFYKYTADYWINGQHLLIKPGTMSLVPPNSDLRYHWRGKSQHLCAHFTFPEFKAGDVITMLTFANISHSFKEMYRRFEDALGWVGSERRRAEVRLWDLLWELAELQTTGAPDKRADPARAVRQMIERRLSEPLRVAELAEEAEISHNHLTRLFRSAYGTTVAGFIRKRRVERAQHLLAHSTLPVKSIAVEVGIPDLHLFNKTIRAVLGRSPRAVRKRKGGAA